MYKTISIGIDQSYKRTGISISADGKLLKVNSILLKNLENNSAKREKLKNYLLNMLDAIYDKAESHICVIERIRLQSQGFLNIDYIKSIGALNALIVDCMKTYKIDTYSVDTRCWKSQVIGTSKPQRNKLGVPDEKWPAVNWVIRNGFEQSILYEESKRKKKGIFVKNGKNMAYNDDASDSAAISMFYFVGDRNKLTLEH